MQKPFTLSKEMQEELDDQIASLANDTAGKSPGRIRLPRGPEDQSNSESTPPQSGDYPRTPAEAPSDDPINPSHYRKHPSGVECIDITEHMNFCVGNAIKYIWRYQDKGDPVENLRKAQWYLDREIMRLTRMPRT